MVKEHSVHAQQYFIYLCVISDISYTHLSRDQGTWSQTVKAEKDTGWIKAGPTQKLLSIFSPHTGIDSPSPTKDKFTYLYHFLHCDSTTLKLLRSSNSKSRVANAERLHRSTFLPITQNKAANWGRRMVFLIPSFQQGLCISTHPIPHFYCHCNYLL